MTALLPARATRRRFGSRADPPGGVLLVVRVLLHQVRLAAICLKRPFRVGGDMAAQPCRLAAPERQLPELECLCEVVGVRVRRCVLGVGGLLTTAARATVSV